MMFNNETKLTGFVLTLITVAHSIFTCFISLIVIIIIIHHFCYHRMKRADKITVLLCTNIYLCILVYMIILSSMNIQTILGDSYTRDFNSSFCTFIGYISPVILCVLYHAFVNQVIIYYEHKWI
jgi:hypothetical protein